jgi:hypothetical protein
MKLQKHKMSTAIVLFLMFAMAISLIALPSATAQETPTKKTYAYIGAIPNPVGVGEEVLLHVGITDAAGTAAAAEPGWKGLSVTITRPDGTSETMRDIRTDTTGGTGVVFVPTMEGDYTLQSHFPEQAAPWSQYGLPAGTIYEASDSELLTLVVMSEPTLFFVDTPLPTEYWSRPVDSQHRSWYSMAGVWLQRYPPNRYGANNEAPETPHVLWAKQLASGGLAGGTLGSEISYEQGDAYEGKWVNTVIVDGSVYYRKFEARGQPYSGNNEVVAVDLKTGEEMWSMPLIGRVARDGTTTTGAVSAANRVIDGVSDQFPDGTGRALSHGQLFYWDSYNLHGVYALLWTVTGSTWQAFDALTGRWVYTILNVPGGTTFFDENNGNIYRIQVNVGQRWIRMWNMSAIVSIEGGWNPHGNVYNASGTSNAMQRAWVYDAELPEGLPGSVAILTDEVVIGGTGFAHSLQPATRVMWGISSKPEDAGRLLFNTTYTFPQDVMVSIRPGYNAISLEDRVFVVSAKETRQYYGFSVDTGQYLWGPTSPPEPYFQAYSMLLTDAWPVLHIAYGKVFTAGQGGQVNAWDIQTGERVWTYDAVDHYGEILFGNNWPIVYAFISDGKVYVEHIEHSPINPRPRGSPFICLNASTGEVIFRVDGLLRSTWNGGNSIIGDSTIVTFNTNDNTVYALGKGASATTVAASPEVSVHGSSVLVKGMVTDVSPGTWDSVIAMRFPSGVPAVADESMGEWMKYVYAHYPRPADVVGVEVVVSVLDPNNNYYEVGRTMADEDGFFSVEFEPEVPGKYTVIAEFEGSKSYYGSHAKTAITVAEATIVAEPTPPPESVADVYFIPAVIGIIIAIAVATIIIVLSFRKR